MKRQWWLAKNPETAGQIMRSRLSIIRSAGEKRRALFHELAKAYGCDLRDATIPQAPSLTLSFNYSRSYIDTWVSQLCKSRVLPKVETTGGDFDAREKARGMNLLFGAEFERLGIYDEDAVWTRDSGVFGLAAAYVCEEFGRPVVERVLPGEFDFDAYEWKMGRGRTLYRTRAYDKYVCAELYPEKRDEILAATSSKLDDVSDVDAKDHDLVTVTMGWRLPSKPGAGDGRYIVAIDKATLEFEEYEHDEFPFAFFPRTKPVVGFIGDSIMTEMLSGQRELDKLNARAQDAIEQVGVPFIFIKRGSVNKSKITNAGGVVAAVFEVDNPQSDVFVANYQPMSGQVLQWKEDLISKMAAVSTVSPMAAMGEKPTGITAASALQLLDDQESERKLIPQRNREQFYVQIAKLIKRVVEGIPGYTVLAKDGGQVVSVKPKEIMLDDKELVYSVMPTNYAARSPAARTQQAQDLMALNPNLPPAQVFKSLDVPEMESFTKKETAIEDWITKQCEMIRKGKSQDANGDPIVPDPYMVRHDGGALGLRVVSQQVAMASCNEEPNDRVDRLRQYGVAMAEIAKKAAQPAEPPPPPMPGGPMPPGMPPPNGMGMPPAAPPMMPPQGMPS